MGQEDLIATIVAATAVLFLLSTGLILFFVFFSRSKRMNLERQKEREIRYIKELAGVKSEVQEQTLLNVARELHDNVGQMLTVCKMKVDSLQADTLTQSRPEVSQVLDEMISEVKSYSRSLNSDRLKNQGLYMAMCNELERIARMGVITVINKLDPDVTVANSDHEVIVFRIFQEVLNNALKHSEADRYEMCSEVNSDHFLFSMSDNGIGFDLTNSEKTSSGLINMRSRAALIDATIELQSVPGKGTSLALLIPRFSQDV